MKTKLLLLAALLALLCATAQAQLTSSESFFGYTPGVELPTDVPSPAVPGYTNNWTDISFGDAEPFTTNGSLAYGGAGYAAGIGNSIGKGADTAGITAANSGRCYRVLDSSLVVGDTTSGIRYLSFLFQTGNENAAGNATTYTTLTLNSGNADADSARNFTLGIADGLGTSDYAFQVDNNAAMISSFGVARDSSVHLFVIKFDLSATAASDSVTAWIDPTLGAGEPAGGITFTGSDLQFDRLVISDYASNSGFWDEIRWGASFDSVTVTNPPVPPSVVAVANPSSGKINDTFTVTATVTPGSGTVTNVSIDLSQINGSAAASLVLSNGNVYTNTFTIPSGATLGARTLVVSAKDTTPLSGSYNLAFSVLPSSVVWDGGSAVDSKWSRATNWQGDLAPSLSGSAMIFAGTTRLTPDMDASYSTASLAFSNNAGSFVIGSSTGSTLTNGVNGIVNNSANAQTLNVPVVLSVAQTFNVAAGSLTLNSNVTGGVNLTTTGAGTVAFGSPGTNSLGNLRVSSGQVSVTAGVVNVNDTSGTLTRVESNATIVVSGGALNINAGGNGWFPIGVTAGSTGSVVVAGGTINVLNNWGTEVGNEAGAGVLTINSGTFLNNDLGGVGLLIGETGSAGGTVNLNGGNLIVNKISANAGGTFYFNGGAVKPLASRTDFMNDAATLNVEVRNGGATADTAGFNITIGEPLYHSSVIGDDATDGGLTKTGNGTLTLSSGYQYTGPTKVLGGTLNLNLGLGVPGTGGDLVVSNATLVLNASSGTAMPAANVTLNSAALVTLTNYAGANAINGTGNLLVQTNTTLNLNYGSLGSNPTMAAINVAGSISVTGTNNVINIAGNGFVVGQFPLIKYNAGTLASVSGFKLGTLPTGVNAVLVNNTGNQSVDLNITLIGQTLTWYGTNALWDINTTYNWNSASAVYLEYGASPNIFGDLVTFDDTLYNDFVNPQATNVNLTTTLHPSQITVNSSLPYSFTGAGSIDGAGSLVMSGSGSLMLGTSNSYSGGTFVNAGTLIITNDSALGVGTNLLTLAGGTLKVDGTMTSARVTAVTANSTVDPLTNTTAQLQLNGVSGGGLTKVGNGTLELSSVVAGGMGDLVVSQGLLKITNGSVIVSATQGNTKIDTGGNVEVAAGATLMITNGVNSWFPLGDTAGTTNTLTIAGTMIIRDNWGIEAPRQGNAILNINGGSLTVNDIGGVGLIMGDVAGTSESGAIHLNDGSLTVNLLRAFNGTNTFYFNGGTLKPVLAGTFFPSSAALSTEVRNGGAIVDTAGLNVTIAEPLDHSQVPGDNAIDGGLTKLGAGTLNLNGTNTYTGPTVVNAGTLGGTGTIAGALTNNATLAPGSSGIGALTVTGNFTLKAASTNTFEVNGTTPANDSVTAGAAVTYGGVLNIVPSGTFTAGQQFQLFSGAGATNTGNFASLAGSPGSGLAFSFTNGVLSVVATGPSGPAAITNSYSGGVLSLSWPAGQGWRLQMQTNSLATGLGTNWVYVTDGTASSTNITVDATKPTVFYRLTYP